MIKDKIENVLVWLAKTLLVSLSIILYAELYKRNILQEWYILCLVWLIIWVAIGIYVKLSEII